MTQMLELSERAFKITMINMFKGSNGKSRNMQAQMDCKQKDGISKKESKGNARNLKIRTKLKSTFNGFIITLGMVKERISELEKRTTEVSQTEM